MSNNGSVNHLIIDNIDIWSSAIKKRGSQGRGSSKKIELYGIKKLRELILELAVRGMLVPQSENDEPASILLEKISAEKALLIEEKKITKTKPFPKIREDEKEFNTPPGWEWLRYGDVYGLEYGKNLPKAKRSNTGEFPVYGSNGIVGSHDRNCIDAPCIVVGRKGSAGALNLCLNEGCWVTDVAYSVIPPKCLSLEFVFKQFHTLGLDSLGKGIKPGLNRNEAYILPIALPPLEEQRRIVAKVDELMTLCDQLEQQQQESSISAHQTLVETLLTALTNAGEKGEFNQAWTRIAEHFDTLFTTGSCGEWSIDQLKQTILQLAVMGKLVPQDPNDEPASVLLEKIAVEKERLVKDKKIKKQKALPPIGEDEKPFELPVGWEWSRIAEFGVVGTGATPSRTNTEYFQPADVNWVTSGETGSDFVFETKEKVSYKAIAETNVSIYPEGTLVIAMYGQGKTRGQITELMIPAGTNQACAAIQLIQRSEAHRKYTKLYFQKAYEELRSHSAGGAQPNLNVGKISLTVLPIPPHEEQKRIVEKVDQLMSFCDKLKVGINESQTTQLHLADAMAEQAIN